MQKSKKNFLVSLTFSLLCALMLVPSAAHASWWNADWSEREKITLDTGPGGAAVSDPIGTMTVLVRLHSGNFKFDQAKPDGGDIRIVASDDTTPLKYHIEKFDNLLGEAFVWVQVPNLKPGTQTSIYLYYGNPKAGPGDDIKASYDADTVLVYHFGEHGGLVRDATQWGNNAQGAAVPASGAIIGDGLRLDGQHPIELPASQSLAWSEGQALTWSAWIHGDAPQANVVLFSRRDGANAFIIGLDAGAPFISVSSAAGTQRSPRIAPLPAASWHHIAVTASGSQITLYVDGSQAATLASAVPVLRTGAVIGQDSAPQAASGEAFVGDLDELEISRVARPAGFIRAEAVGQGPQAGKFVSFGTTEEDASWFSGYIGVILKSVTIDGWVIIAILGVMALVSWGVMVDKAAYISRVAKANTVFLRHFGKLAEDLTQLDHVDAGALGDLGEASDLRQMRASPLYHIYHIGAREIAVRARNPRFREEGLLPQSIAAIRSALDGRLVREQQQINRAMVLLTIAISGGPFFGLLGTVLGIIITFAAIAITGEVNINAIAPGCAAALVATAAGLFVAIPALFGYNYLNTRIRNITADMQVFVDEFTTKMAEFYRPRGSSRLPAE